MECDYTFPVGNVKIRDSVSIEPNQDIDRAIKNAKKILSTSNYIGTYHSHPNESTFDGWSGASNGDILHATSFAVPFMIIIGIVRSNKNEKPQDRI